MQVHLRLLREGVKTKALSRIVFQLCESVCRSIFARINRDTEEKTQPNQI